MGIVIDKSLARCVGRIFMLVYRKGVNDAYRHSDDEGMLMEHIELTSEGGKWGYVGEASGSWIYWRNRLSDVADMDRGYKVAERYWQGMRNYGANYMSVALVVAQAFYNKGIQDYMENPGAMDISIYNDRPLNWWGGAGQWIGGYRLRGAVQDICCRRIDEIEGGRDDKLKRDWYEVFMTAFSISIVAR